ncbi:MAG: aldehyde dehydrogenase family protein [bacterium JZ-2024 1]
MKMLIGGKWTESESGEWMEIRNPATGEVVDTVPKGNQKDAHNAIAAASEAFSVWRTRSPEERAHLLYRVACRVEENLESLSTILTMEQGKPKRESRAELRRFSLTLKYYAGCVPYLRGDAYNLDSKNYLGFTVKQPLGVCGAIVPWNFPISLMGNKIAPALLAGNTVVVKPASTTPLCAIRVVEIFHHEGIPPGVLNLVTGPGSVVGGELLKNPAVRKVGFTGETETGKFVMQTASEDLKRLTLELGGSDPMIVCEDADLDRAVKSASVGRFFNCGQACIAVKRLFLLRPIADIFLEKLLQRVARIRVGNGLNEETILGPLHTQHQREEIEAMVQDAVSRGAKILFGGKRPEGEEFSRGYFYLPTLLTHVPDDAWIAREECFGPVLPIFQVNSLEEAVEKANLSRYGLGSSIWTKDIKKVRYALDNLHAGITWVNTPPSIFDEIPFGGIKHSGYGKEHGLAALDYYLETKSVVLYAEK